MLKQLTYIFLFVFSINAFAQKFSEEELHQIDSLKRLIDNPKIHDTTLAASYLRISEILYVSNFDTLSYFAEKSKAISEKGLQQKNSELVERSFKISLATAYNNIGFVLAEKGNNSKALEIYHQCLRVYEAINDLDGIATSLNNIGSIYDNQDDFKNALIYYERYLKIREQLKEKKGIAIALNNIGGVYNGMGDYEKALFYYKKSLQVRQNSGNKEGLGNTLNNIGMAYYRQKQYDTALVYFRKSLAIYKLINSKAGFAASYSNIGLAYFDSGKLKEAKENGLKGFEIAKEINYPEYLKRSASLLSKIYQKENKWHEAFEMQNLFISMRDTINNEKTKRDILKQEVQYAYDKQKALDDKEHEKELAVSEQHKRQQKIITYAIGFGLLLVIVFSLVVVNRLKVTKQQKIIIEQQKHLVDVKNKEVTDSITYAKRIQEAILPTRDELNTHLKNGFVFYLPKDIVAGDFYWLEKVEDTVIFAAADCTGHGVPGAMVSVICHGALNRSVREYQLTNPGKILDKTRELVIETFEKSNTGVKDGMDIALCALNLRTKILQYAGASNPLYVFNSKGLIEIKADKQPIGKYEVDTPFTTHEIQLEKGDTIYVFTDGFTDQFGGQKGKKFMHKAFKELLTQIQHQSMDEQKLLLEASFVKWKGALEQVDDVCVIGVRI